MSVSNPFNSMVIDRLQSLGAALAANGTIQIVVPAPTGIILGGIATALPTGVVPNPGNATQALAAQVKTTFGRSPMLPMHAYNPATMMDKPYQAGIMEHAKRSLNSGLLSTQIGIFLSALVAIIVAISALYYLHVTFNRRPRTPTPTLEDGIVVEKTVSARPAWYKRMFSKKQVCNVPDHQHMQDTSTYGGTFVASRPVESKQTQAEREAELSRHLSGATAAPAYGDRLNDQLTGDGHAAVQNTRLQEVIP